MRRGAWCLWLALAWSSAYAGLFDDEEARRQIRELGNALQARVDALDKRLETLSRNQLGFTNDLEALRAELAPLRGQVEVLQNALDAALKRQQDFYVDLDARLRKLEDAARENAKAPSSAPTEAAPDPQAEIRAYEAALALFRENRYGEAQAAFETFIATHPKSSLLPSAHYWFASSLYQQKRYDAAAKAFAQVANQWPKDAKAPDALLAQANALIGAKDLEGAQRVLEMLIAQYPATAAAETARQRLKTLAPKKKR